MTRVQSASSTAGSSLDGALERGVLALLDTTAGQVSVLVVGWAGMGIIAAVVLRMRGHEFRPYAALGAVLGPVFLFLAYDAVRRRESRTPITVSAAPDSSGSPVLVVAVGELDGEAVRATFESIAPEIGPVTAAVPVEYEVAERVHRMGVSPPESENLERLARALDAFSPGLMMLPGRVDQSIVVGAGETGAELVVLVGDDSANVAPELESALDTNVIRVGT